MDATKKEILGRVFQISAEIDGHEKGKNPNGVIPDYIHEAAIQSLRKEMELMFDLFEGVTSRDAINSQIRDLQQKQDVEEQKIKELLNKIEQLKVPSAG